MDTTAIIAIFNIIKQIPEVTESVKTLIQKVESGQEITQEEINQARQESKQALNQLKKQLGE